MTRTDDLSGQGLALPSPLRGVRFRTLLLWASLLGYGGVWLVRGVEKAGTAGFVGLAVMTSLVWLRWGGLPVRMARDFLYAQAHVPVESRRSAKRVPGVLTGALVPVALAGLYMARVHLEDEILLRALAGAALLLLLQARPAWRVFKAWALTFRYPRCVRAGQWDPYGQRRRWFFVSLALALTLGASSYWILRDLLVVPAVLSVSLVVAGLAHLPAAYALGRMERGLRELPGAGEPPTLDVLQGRVQAASSSRHDGEPFEASEHLLLGRRLGAFDQARSPIFLQLAHLQHHVYIAGGPGSGKSNMLNGMLAWILSLGDKAEERPAVFFLDMKGDHVSAETARLEAERHGYQAKFFSLDSTLGMERFNLLEQLCWTPAEPGTLRSLLMSALHLVHGDEHGTRFFAGQSRAKLHEATTDDESALNTDALENFRALYRAVKDVDPRGVTELSGVLQELADYEQLHTERTWRGIPRVNIEEALEEGQLVYAWLQPTSDGASGVKEVARMMLHAVVHEASRRAKAGKPKRDVYIFMDEFQQALSEGLSVFLEQARSFGVRLILANQTPAALKQGKYTNLIPTIQANTGTKILFTIDDAQMFNEVVSRSGEKSMLLGTRAIIRPKLSPDEVNFVSNTPGAFLLNVRGCESPAVFSEHFSVGEIIYPISKDEYERRSRAALPTSGIQYPAASDPTKRGPELPFEDPPGAADAKVEPTPQPAVPAERLQELAASIRSRLGLNQVASA